MNKKIKIKVSNYLPKFFDKCIKNKIDLYDITYLNEDEIIVLININDFKKIKKLNYYSKIIIYDYDGILKIKNNISKNKYYYLMFIFCFVFMDIITSYIVDIDIIHENKNIRALVKKELNNHNIKKYTLAYSFDELEKIKNQIIKDNKNELEWISITRSGMKYIIKIQERVIKKTEKEEGYRNIIAKKDGSITKVISNKGEVLVRSGDYVKKGDILISGQINLYENVMGNTMASGNIYANVWYKATISYPKKIITKKITGNKRYNININNKIFLKNKYKNFYQENIKELKIFGIKIKIYKEVEYLTLEKKLTNKENEQNAINKLKEEFNKKLKSEGTIERITILNKSDSEDNVDYTIFVVTNENIGEYQYYDIDNNS